MAESIKNELGYFGNIWVRSHQLIKEGDAHDGHTHHFDHVTMLVSGKVRVDVEDIIKNEKRSKEFEGPTFIIIRKEHKHKITALTDNVIYYCVFALRNIDGDVTDIYSKDNDPSAYGAADDNYWRSRIEELDRKTTKNVEG